MGKCYFAKHKLVWEVLDGGLKNKIEIQWSDIVAIKASYPEDAPGTLDVVVILLVFCLLNMYVFVYTSMKPPDLGTVIENLIIFCYCVHHVVYWLLHDEFDVLKVNKIKQT